MLAIGPPGSGKTTYCRAMYAHMKAHNQNVLLVNLDPANDTKIVNFDIDVRELISLEDVMDRLNLGPNGGLMFCMEYLADNLEWLKEKLKGEDPYLIIDSPGQVELFTHHDAIKSIVKTIHETWEMRLCAVNIVDSHHCYDFSKFISGLLLSLSSMLQLELPHVNVLSKVDLLDHEALPHRLEMFTSEMDLAFMAEAVADQDPIMAKYGRLSAAFAELVDDFGLVQFLPLSVKDDESVAKVAKLANKASGHMYMEGDD
eukprot:m.340803 g.340803  ORF g.340803 m.340803 type:complete len:258 (-) comp19556_c0_seq1:165-938(-)